MNKTIVKVVSVAMLLILGGGAMSVYADGEEEGSETNATETVKTSLTLSPVSRTLQISSNSVYDGKLSVSNDGQDETKVIVYAAPYFYTYSEQDNAYKLNFSSENNYTQIARWITIKDTNGSYVTNPSFAIPAGEKIEIEYRITTPSSIPSGGQYGAIFVQTASGSVNQSGIHTETSAGMVIYGHSSEGESVTAAEFQSIEIKQGRIENDGSANNHIYGSAVVKNTGNVDFFAKGKLTVEPIIGFSRYGEDSPGSTVSVIPESERAVEEEWAETPSFGLYKVTWTVIAGGEEQTVERIIFLVSPFMIIVSILVLTFIILMVIIGIRHRKERRSRLAI